MSDDIVKRILLEAGNLKELHGKGVQVAEREVSDLRKAFDAAVAEDPVLNNSFNDFDLFDGADMSEDSKPSSPTKGSPGGGKKGGKGGSKKNSQKNSMPVIPAETKRAKQCEALLRQLEEHVAGDLESKTGDKGGKKLTGAENWKFANIPKKRRLQSFVVSCLLFFTGMPACLIFSWILLFNWFTMPFMVAYYIYIFMVPVKHPQPKRKWWVHHGFWKHYRDYFPVRLVIPKKVQRQITPDRNYMFIYHPHGVHSFGAMINFGSEVNDLAKLLPGINLHTQSLGMNFYIPFWRELFVWGGTGDASAKTIKRTLAHAPGESILLVVGGAEESLMSSPHTNDLTLSKRKGFVKIALTTGSPLVPVFGFGETNVYGNLAAGRPALQKFLKTCQKKLGFALPMISGRGWFNYNFGLMPHRRPIVTVVGEPLKVPKIEKPTQEDIDKYHRLYVDSLVALYNEHKSVYDIIGKDIRIL